MRFVVVDDSRADRELVVKALRRDFEGAEFVQVPSLDTLAALEDTAPDLVITDYRLQQGDGIQVLRWVQQHWPGVPVLMFTETGDEQVAVAGMKAGLDDYVLKSNPLRLPLAVGESLEKARLQREHAQVTRRLQVADTCYRAVSDLSSGYSYALHIEPDGSVVGEWITEGVVRVTGYRAEEMHDPEVWQRLTHPDDLTVAGQHRARVMAGPGTGTAEFRIVTKDGRVRWLRDTARSVHDAERPEVLRVFGMAEDVTERRSMEDGLRQARDEMQAQVAERTAQLAEANRALAENAERYRQLAAQNQAILDNLSEGLIIANMQGNVLEMNPAALRMHGFADQAEAHRQLAQFAARFELRYLDGRPMPLEEWPLARALRGERFTGYEALVHDLHTGREWVGSYGAAQVHDENGNKDAQGQAILTILTLRDVTEHRRAESELRGERELLQTIYDTVPVMFTVYDPTIQEVTLNRHVERVTGWTPEDTARTNIMELAYPDPDYRAEVTAYMQSLQPGFKDLQMRTKDGQVVESSWANVQIPDGRQVGIGIDITERKRMEEALRKSEAKLRAIFGALVEGVVFLNPQGEVQEINGAVERIHGHTLHELADPQLDPRGQIVRPDGTPFPVDEQPAMVALRTGQAVRDVEMGVPTSDGRLRWRLVNAQPAYDDQGRLLGAVASFFDITERREAQIERERLLGEVQRRAAELDAAFEALPHGLILHGLHGEILRQNRAVDRMVGYTPDEQTLPMRERWAEMSFQRSEGELVTNLSELPPARALRGETVQNMILSWQRRPGDDRGWFSVSAAPIRDENGRVLGAVSTFSDVTEMRAMQQRLQEANEELECQAEELEVQTEELRLHNQRLREATQELDTQRSRLEAIMAALPVGVFLADAHGRIVEINDVGYQIWGRSAPRPQGVQGYAQYRGWWADSGRLIRAEEWSLARALQQGETSLGERIDIQRFDGSSGTILSSAAPIHDGEGNVTGAVAVVQDITRQRTTEVALEQRNRDLQLLNRLGRELGTTLDLEQVLERVLEAVREVLPARGAAVWLCDPGQPTLTCQAASFERPANSCVGVRLQLGEGIPGWVAQYGETALVPSTREDARFSPATDRWTGVRTHSVLAVPLQLREGVAGVLEVLNPSRRHMDPQTVELLETLAASAATAVENARLHGRVRQAAAAEERSRLARELHDAVSQALFSASIIADSLPALWEHRPERAQAGLVKLRDLVQTAMVEMRTLLLELRPGALLETDMGELLRQLARSAAARAQTPLEIDVQIGDGHLHLPSEVKLALYRIAQEALSNTVKHGRARQATVHLHPDGGPGEDGSLVLQINDDGQGFEPDNVPPNRLGLAIMRERALAAGASLEITSAAGQGTQVRAVWPAESQKSVIQDGLKGDT